MIVSNHKLNNKKKEESKLSSLKRKGACIQEGRLKKLKTDKVEGENYSKPTKRNITTKNVQNKVQESTKYQRQKRKISEGLKHSKSSKKSRPVCTKFDNERSTLASNTFHLTSTTLPSTSTTTLVPPKTSVHTSTSKTTAFPSKFTTHPSSFSTTTNTSGQFETTEDLVELTNDKPTDISSSCSAWKDEDYLAESEGLKPITAKNIIKLFDDNNTIPFIARYRSHLTEGLKPDELRKAKATYDYIKQVHKKAAQLIQQISSENVINPNVFSLIETARTFEELEFIGSSFKKSSQGTLAERARKLGLEEASQLILKGEKEVKQLDLENQVSVSTKGLESVQKVKLGIQHIIADVISKDTGVRFILDKIIASEMIELKSQLKAKPDENPNTLSKYSLYGDFSVRVGAIKPYQVLAINRGEAENELSVKIDIPTQLWKPLKFFCNKKWSAVEMDYPLRKEIIRDSIDDAIKRLLGPLVIRQVREKLRKKAEEEAIIVFGSNLRQLLLTPPCPGKTVLGIDPGFRHGCKMAVVSSNGNYLAFDKMNLNNKKIARQKIIHLVLRFNCTVIALGNGTGCRETEELLSSLIEDNAFKPLNVSYKIISEQGVSIYSCSSVASDEFPDLEATVVSPISIARRLQNPISELVKVDPEHLGVGMYQHDVNKKKLIVALDEIISECVSFVGVDINTASFHLLKRVAGLGESKAKEIIKYRSENCAFKFREDVMKVKGIKDKTFRQCAGFIRIVPSTAVCKKACFHGSTNFNPLDQTSIHPETYEITEKLIQEFHLTLNDLGKPAFIELVKCQMKNNNIKDLAFHYNCSIPSMTFIIDTLMKPLDFDFRMLSGGPVFQQKIRKAEDLTTGQSLTGIVRNVVPFGAFVDVGVGINGLIHISNMRDKSLHINDSVLVCVLSVNVNMKKIQLKLISVLTET